MFGQPPQNCNIPPLASDPSQTEVSVRMEVGEVATANVENAQVDTWWLVDHVEHGEQGLPNRFDEADLAVVAACLDPDAVFVRAGRGRHIRRRDAGEGDTG